MNDSLFRIYSNRTEFWRQFLSLYLLTVAAQLSNIYYQYRAEDSLSTTLFTSLAFLSVVTVPCLLLGLKLGKPLGLGLVNDKPETPNSNLAGIRFALTYAIPLGIFLLVLRWVLQPYLPAEIPEYGFRGVTGGLLVSFGAAIGEEVWFRLGLMTLLLFAFRKLVSSVSLSDKVAVGIILFVGVCFGAAHIPQLISYDANTAFAVAATILGNLCVAVLYGWCFWRYGLLSAFVAHFSLDLVLHVLPALI